MFVMSPKITKFPLKPLGECVEVLDRLRKPINSAERRTRKGVIPYYGANGQVDTIDDWIFDEELVLVAEDGGFFDDPLRPISYRISGKAWVNNHAHVLRPLKNMDVDWINYCISFQDISAFIKGATLKKLNQKDLKKILIPSPQISEQRRIVARIKECLDRVNEIEKLRSDGINDIKIVSSSLYAYFYKNCKWAKKNIADLVNATKNGKSIKQENENSTGFVLSLKSVHDISLNFEHKKKINLNDKNAKQYKIIEGDVFVSRSNTRELVGLASVATESPEGIIFPDLLIKLEPKNELIRSRFLAYALRSPESRAQIKERAVGTSQSMVKISGQRLKEISIPVPSLDVQDKLITRFDKLHDLSSTVLSDFQSQNLGSLRQAILRKAFAGEL